MSRPIAWALPALALALIAPRISLAQGACGCPDVRDLNARYCVAKAAIEEWDRLIERTAEHDAKTEKVELMLPGTKKEVRDCVDETADIAKVQFPDPNPAANPVKSQINGGETDSNCNITVTTQSACLKDVLTAHEQLHQQRCLAVKGLLKDRSEVLGFVVDHFEWRAVVGESLVDYMLEERMGYALEMSEIASRLRQMYDRCPTSFPLPKPNQPRKFTLKCPQLDRSKYESICKRK